MKKIKPILLVTLFLMASLFTQSQILNIDKTDSSAYSKKMKLKFNFNIGLSIDKQKKTLYTATNASEILMLQNKSLILMASNFRFTYYGPEDILNAGYLHIKHRHQYKAKYQPESFVQVQWDNRRGLTRRFLIGFNLRYNFWKAEKLDMNAGLGLMYENENWNYTGVDAEKIPANPVPISNQLLKLNSYIRFDWKPSTHSEIVFNMFVQTRLNSLKPRIAPNIVWDIHAGKHFGFRLNFSGMYDAAPVVPIPHFYYNVSNGLFYKF